VAKLKAMLREDADATALRKKVVELQAERASMRQAMKRIARERDQLLPHTRPKFREAAELLSRRNYGLLVKALHSDRVRHVSASELKAAERVCIALRPLFVDEG
jgi:hypothetical protein